MDTTPHGTGSRSAQRATHPLSNGVDTMAQNSSASQPSVREEAYTKLLEEALSRPGIREVMHVYGGWRQAEQGLDPHRVLAHLPQQVMTTDHANQQ